MCLNNMKIFDKVMNGCLLVAGFCFLIPALNVIVQEFFWCIKMPNGYIGGLVACVVGILIVYWMTRRFNKNVFLPSFLLFGLLVLIAVVAALYFYDTTRDGVAYHQEAIMQIKDGWNPILTPLPDSVPYRLYINYYPKAFWINAATIYDFTEKIESGKLFNMLYPVGTFLLVFYLLIRLQLRLAMAFAGALLATLNSVMIVQFQSYMVDHINASIITAMVACLVLVFVVPDRCIGTCFLYHY